MSVRDYGMHGWQLVPLHMTSKMMTEVAYTTQHPYHQAQSLWNRLLEQAPLPPEQSIEAALLHAKADALSGLAIRLNTHARGKRQTGDASDMDEAAEMARMIARALRVQAAGGGK